MTTPNRPPLSPAAQAVIDAAEEALSDFENYGHNYTGAGIAAALRAAADQIQPSQQNYADASHGFEKVCLNGMAYAANELRVIAAELEAQP